MKLLLKIVLFSLLICSCQLQNTTSDNALEVLTTYLEKYKSINNASHFLEKLYEEETKKERAVQIVKLFHTAFNERENFEALTSIIDKHSVRDLLGTFKKSFGDSDQYSKFQALVLTEADQNTGKSVEDFKFMDIKNQEHRISDYKGQLVVIDFWATWCKPCLKLEPDFKRMVKKYEDNKNVKFISLAVRQSEEPWKKHINENETKFPYLLDGIFLDRENYDIPLNTFDLLSIPKFAFIDKNGKIIYSNGPQPDSQYFDQLIAEHI